MKAYKLLNQKLQSHNNTQWEIGKTIKVEIPGNEMCTKQVLHYYNHPLLAILLNPIHVNIYFPRLFEIEIDEEVNSDGLKFASKSQTLIEEIPIPEISNLQRIEIAIRIVKTVYFDEKWNQWADKWLDGSDRSSNSAAMVAAYVSHTCDDAAYHAAYAAADAASYNVSAANAIFYVVAADKYCNDVKTFNAKLIEIVEMIVNPKM